MTTLLLFSLLGAVLYFSNIRTEMTEVSVFRDVTDSILAKPETKQIQSLFHLSGDKKYNGAQFRFANLSDVSYNQSFEAVIEPTGALFANELTRDKQITRFNDSISNILEKTKGDSIGREHSSLYVPLATELNHLAQSDSKTKIAVVYSDLMENDLDISLYNQSELQLIESNPDTLKTVFEKRLPLSSLHGVTVYLIYQPKDVEGDREFRIVSGFYKKMLEEKGAIVFITANLSL